MATFKAKRYSECGPVMVRMTPSGSSTACGGEKQAVRISIGKWKPKSPLCLPYNKDIHTRSGRKYAADAAVDFYEYHKCGQGGLDGLRRRKKRKR
jgi:hypothetical protein